MKKNIVNYLIPLLVLASCGGQEGSTTNNKIQRIDDERNLSEVDYTINSLNAVDALGREVKTVDTRKEDKDIGIFYHIWHGYHNTGIFNITELLDNDPESLWDPNGNTNSPLEAFHYWGEPLYGYYNSSDPWVISRHMELLTMAGVDYLVYDLTNSVIYFDAINAIFKVLDQFQKQGFNVPKVAFYTNTGSGNVINSCYESWYKKGLYSNLWYSKDGKKPLIIGKKDDIRKSVTPDKAEEIINFFQIKESQWPDTPKQDLEEGFPWMDWGYPQKNFSGTMSVSLAQHPGMRMSEGEMSNNGRGFDYTTFMNDEETMRAGTNFQGQWKTVFDNIDEVDNVFVTGFNEWIAQKKADGAGRVYFVDTFNEEYSRDVEMYRDGYGDNFYLQLAKNDREFAYTEAKHYKYPTASIDINDFSSTQWENATAKYLDFAGDAIERDFISADKVNNLRDTSNRNDIVKTTVTHDKTNLYFRVETKENLTAPTAGDHSWMNILISTSKNENNWLGYDYIVNRDVKEGKGSLERLREDFMVEKIGEVDLSYQDNVLQVSIPLKSISKDENDFHISFKVCDNIQEQDDILDYYISGDSAPIGRLNYSYGY